MSTNDFVLVYMRDNYYGKYRYFSGSLGTEKEFYYNADNYCYSVSAAPISSWQFVAVVSYYNYVSPTDDELWIAFHYCDTDGPIGGLETFDSVEDSAMDEIINISAASLANEDFVVTYKKEVNMGADEEGWYMFYDKSLAQKNTHKFSDGPNNICLTSLTNGNFVITYENSLNEGLYNVYDDTGSILYSNSVFDDNNPGELFTMRIDNYIVISYLDFMSDGYFQVKTENHGVHFERTSLNEVTLYNNTTETLELYISAVQ
ncbi:MAG: hypothetical protein JEY99_20875 [Spirochaetales bacterium]|nr:hypothetical protein [Spirochaetales bacterium]